MNTGRKIGISVFALMKKSGMNRKELATKLNYTHKDMCRIFEGRLLLSTSEIERIAMMFGLTKQELLDYAKSENKTILQYTKDFNDNNNLEYILDLMDDVADLKAAM